MEWDKANSAAAAAAGDAADEMGGGREALGYVKAMTDEQMEVLRKQISIYAIICEQLVEMQRALTTHQDSVAGGRAHVGGGGILDSPDRIIASQDQIDRGRKQ